MAMVFMLVVVVLVLVWAVLVLVLVMVLLVVVLVLVVQAPDQRSTVGGLLSISPPEDHYKRRTFCRRGGNPRTYDSGSTIDS
jgi:hypothetical protein